MWLVSNLKIYWFCFKHYSYVLEDSWSCNSHKYFTNNNWKLLIIVKLMTNHDNFFSQYFLCVLDPLLGSAARYQKISRPPFARESRGYAAAQPMFLKTIQYLSIKLQKLFFNRLFHVGDVSRLISISVNFQRIRYSKKKKEEKFLGWV